MQCFLDPTGSLAFTLLISNNIILLNCKLMNLETWILEYLNTWILEYLNTWIFEYLNTFDVGSSILLEFFYSSAVFVSLCMFACAIPRWCYAHDSYIWLYRHVGGAVVSKNACFWWPPITIQRPSTQRTFSEQQAAAHPVVVARTRCVMRGVVIISDKLFNDTGVVSTWCPLTYLHPQALQDWEGKTGG